VDDALDASPDHQDNSLAERTWALAAIVEVVVAVEEAVVAVGMEQLAKKTRRQRLLLEVEVKMEAASMNLRPRLERAMFLHWSQQRPL